MNTKSKDIKKKRKNIDIPEDTFKFLSVKAAVKGVNLKRFIEDILEESVEDMRDSEIYTQLQSSKPDGFDFVSEDEADYFEESLES